MKILLYRVSLGIIGILFPFALNAQLRVVCTAALINNKFDMRKSEYIKCMLILAKFGYKNPYVIESIRGSGPTFLDQYSTNVFYSKSQDFNVKDIRNKGINEARTMLDGFKHFNFHPNDMILKLTGRYHLTSDQFIRIIKQNPHVDAFVKVIRDGTWVITGCFALRYHYFKDMLENLDYNDMEKNFIYLESKVMDYLKKMIKGSAKVMFVNELHLSANVLGAGQYALMHF